MNDQDLIETNMTTNKQIQDLGNSYNLDDSVYDKD